MSPHRDDLDFKTALARRSAMQSNGEIQSRFRWRLLLVAALRLMQPHFPIHLSAEHFRRDGSGLVKDGP
jgi:hypothetical protein